jgi:hypothetical protein
MSDTKEPGWTKGPWNVDTSPLREAICVVSDDTWICGELQNGEEMSQQEALANAKLIAAAPELYQELEEAEAFIIVWAADYQFNHKLKDFHPRHQAALDKTRAALKLAREGR